MVPYWFVNKPTSPGKPFSGFNMVLDPFSALGLAGNIIQLVDFTLKLVSDAREIQGSVKGLTSRHDFLDSHSEHLLGITALINEASADGAAAVGPGLIGLCNNCGDIANTIQQALEDFKAKEERTRWKSFVQAMKQSGRTGQLVDLFKKIESSKAS